ncbi:MAG: Clp protease N-terminal domain-containing protein [Cyanobacteria bacterium P01_G01_bin.38]
MENRLRSLRTQHKWSQARLAELLNVSRQTINAIEKGKYDPSLPLAIKIAQLFGCSIENIFFTENAGGKMMSNPGSMLEQFTSKVAQVMRFIRLDEGKIFDKFTPHAIQVIMLAQEESRRLKHNFVGTEQILLGLILEESGFASQLLKTVGVSLKAARVEIEKMIGYGRGETDIKIPFTPRARFALECASEESRRRKQDFIGTEHLLMGVLRSEGGVAVRALRALGFNISDLRLQVLDAMKTAETLTPDELQAREMTGYATSASTSNPYSTPADFTSGVINTRFCRLLSAWVEPRQLGYVVSSNSGFQSSDGEILAPHISFYSSQSLRQIPRIYPESLPDLVIEIKSAFDQLTSVQAKISRFLELGVGQAVLIDPDERRVYVYAAADQNCPVSTFTDGEKLTLPELLPGWEIDISALWPSS